MGSVHEAQAHQGALRAENIRPDLIQGLPAQVVIPVAGGTGKAGFADPMLPEGRHNAPGALLRNGVDLPEAGLDARLGLPGQLIQIYRSHYNVSRYAFARRSIFSKSSVFPTQEGEWM